MLRIFLYHINEQELEAGRERALSTLPSWRVEKYERMRPPKAKLLELAAGLLLRHAVLKVAGLELSSLDISYGEQKKPYFTDLAALDFNISHSGEYVAVALAGCAVGIDVEIKTDPGHGVAEHVFSAEELETLHNSDEPKRMFTYLWTRKEAYVKCTGTGITVPLNSFSVLPDTLGEYLIRTPMVEEDFCLSFCVPKADYSKFTLDIVEHFDI